MATLKVAFNAPLNEGDSEEQTYGCRQNNPDIGGANGIEGVCAFSAEDGICKRPPKAWKKQFHKLRDAE